LQGLLALGPSERDALRASEARFRQLFENMLDGVYEVSSEGQILAANPALIKMLGFESEHELKTFGLTPELYENLEVRERTSEILEQTGELRNAEFNLIRRDGRRITVLENSRAVRNESGAILYYQGTLTDITELRQATHELLEARDKALEASRLKSQFLANISHELRTPLNAVIGMSGLLLDGALEKHQRECAETIHDSAQYLLDIISEILDFSKIEAGRMEIESISFSPRTVVDDAIALFAEQAGSKGVELICDVAPDVPESIMGDPGRVRQVLMNLLSNAVKFTSSGEVIATVARTNGDPFLRFELLDSGIGIPDDASTYIFEAFRQADGSTTRRYGGTGLGLAICREMVRMMGGAIGVSSRPGQGSRFWFTIPFGADAVPARPAAPLPPVRVAVVSGNLTSRETIGRWVRRWGARAELFPNADAAAAYGRCTVWILDEHLFCAEPEASTLPSIARHPGRRVILLTALGKRRDLSEGCGGMACIRKPVREREVHAVLRRFLSHEGSLSPSLEALAQSTGADALPGRLLIAEDNQINQKVILRMVEKLGYQADVVANGREVIEALSRRRYNVVLMDCQMPEMDGFEATAALRAKQGLAQLPIVAVTAHAVQGDREACLAAGMDDYLSKPLRLEDLARVLERWMQPPLAPLAPIPEPSKIQG
jgi:two-component system sensor histidine kinase/response regulator